MSFIDKLKNYAKKVDKVEKENKKLTKRVRELESNMDGCNALFNNLFLYYDFTPNKLLTDAHEVILQMLDFIDNVCKKHDIQWSIYAGNILGAVRHGGFIPWDDDCDIVMIRKDYNKFLEVIDDEIDRCGLHNKIRVKTNKPVKNRRVPFTKMDFWHGKDLIGFIDIFPLDYVTDIENMEERYAAEYHRLRKDLETDMPFEENLSIAFENLSVSMEETDHIISGVEIGMSKRPTPYIVYKTSQVFPLIRVKFEDRFYPCLNDPIFLLDMKYGDYMKIPKNIKIHNFHYRLLTTENVEEVLEENIKLLSEANSNCF